jgi:hypothetical protein
VKGSVLIGSYDKISITDDVIRKYRIGNSVGNTGINAKPDIIFGHGELFSHVQNLNFHVDDSDLRYKKMGYLFGARVDEVEPGFEQPVEPAELLNQPS